MPRNITVQFSDGTSHVYQNAPDSLTPEQAEARARKDFPGKNVAGLDGGRKAGNNGPTGYDAALSDARTRAGERSRCFR